MNFLLSIILLPFLAFSFGSEKKTRPVLTEPVRVHHLPDTQKTADIKAIVPARWEKIYDSAQLERFGLKKEVFQKAYRGYEKLLNRGWVNKEDILTICDFGQSYRRKRLYVIDLAGYQLLVNTLVAHGQGSGGEFPSSFSNDTGSHKSSLGFYTTAETYYGEHGYSLRLRGREPGINDRAYERDVVIHSSDYVSDEYLRANNRIGRSWGCPAIPVKYNQKVINLIRNGSCLYIHHPSKNYQKRSRLAS
ncbi:MAG: murein L,D-transpeptidase catalytic domain family protein [Dinghuibacter sp.]|nr:murein L,D-transpeptidase catalytic domain family protein [Dinghuibacter sp.]